MTDLELCRRRSAGPAHLLRGEVGARFHILQAVAAFLLPPARGGLAGAPHLQHLCADKHVLTTTAFPHFTDPDLWFMWPKQARVALTLCCILLYHVMRTV